MQNAAILAAAHDTQKQIAFGVRCSFVWLAFFGCRLARLPLCFTMTACSPSAVASSLPTPTHIFSYIVSWVFMVICECCFVLAVCHSFGELLQHGSRPTRAALLSPRSPPWGLSPLSFPHRRTRSKAPPLPPRGGGAAKKFVGVFSVACSVFVSAVSLSVFSPLSLRFCRCWAVAVSVMVLLATLSIFGGTIYQFLCPDYIQRRHLPPPVCVGTPPRWADDLSPSVSGGRFIRF